MKKLFQHIRNVMASVAFAEADESKTAVKMAFPEAENTQRSEATQDIREENRPVLYS